MTKKNNNYDFDLIIPSEVLKENQKKESDKVKGNNKKRHIRKWVKATLLLILGALIGIIIYTLFTVISIHNTPVGDYTCRGALIKVCTGSKDVASYLGI